jgi:magnesium transporter
MAVVHEAINRIVNSEDQRSLKCDHVYYTLLDCIVDNYFPATFYWSEKIDNVEEYVFDPESKGVINEIVSIRKGLLALKRFILPQREILYKLTHTEINFIGGGSRIYLRDVFDHLVKTYNTIEEQRDILSNLMDAHFSKTSAELNGVMKRLTIISTIFMPLTFIVGVYGMNFRYMPELEWHYGYFLVAFIMLALGLGFFWYFKKRKWF